MADATATATAPPSFDVVDAFGRFAQLVRRSPTLDGSVSLRAVQGCAPLLEGNELGLQVVLTRPLRAERVLGRWRVSEDETWAAIERARRTALPILRARGLLPRDAWAMLDRGVLTVDRGWLRLWTGLCVRPRAGVSLLATTSANRRNRSFVVRERLIPEQGGWVPLWLELRPASDAKVIDLQGEVGCLVVVEPGLDIRRRTLAERPEAAREHLRFYEQSYFEAKKRGEITRRYRKLIESASAEHKGDSSADVVEVGPCPGEVETLEACLLPSGPAERLPDGLTGLTRMRFDAVLPFGIRWDGHTVRLDYDRARLMALASAIGPAMVAAAGPELVAANPGALLYLSKYFTPHPPGEPHFFVKPWAFTVLPAGWSAMVDGIHGEGYDVLRGVVHADQFFATPAVFQLFAMQEPFHVDAGQPLIRVQPIPRSRLRAGHDQATLDGIEPA